MPCSVGRVSYPQPSASAAGSGTSAAQRLRPREELKCSWALSYEKVRWFFRFKIRKDKENDTKCLCC